MKKLLSILVFATSILLSRGTARAQLAPPNASGVTMGHVHLNVVDVEASKKLWLSLGGTAAKLGPNEVVKFPNVLIILRKADPLVVPAEPIVNHLGFLVRDGQDFMAKWKAAGARIEPNANGRTGYVYTPEGERFEILERTTILVPIQFDQVHFFVPEDASGGGSIADMLAWYAKLFGAQSTAANLTAAIPWQAAPDLASDVLRTLETEFQEISVTLNYEPPEPIGVILYTNQAFVDITRAPGWVGALNDGRIRVPVEGLTSMTDELARVLKHELTHSFVGQKTGGRCPVWLQEGIAQYMEGKRSRNAAATLSAAYENHMDFSLTSYETSWMTLPRDTAASAYAWSLAVVETIVVTDGMDDLGRILDRIAAQDATEDAVRAVLRDSYPELMQSTVQYLRKAYM